MRVTSAGGGGAGGPETDPIATPALTAHKTSNHHDVHNDGRYDALGTADGVVGAHTADADPHGARAYADQILEALKGVPPAALDTLAEIAAQLQSDESGAAAMLASINTKAAQADLDALRLIDLNDVNLAGIVDGQLPGWSASAQRFIPATPSGASEVAYAENGSGVVTGPVAGVSNGYGVAVAIPLTDIIVPPSTRPIYLDAWALGQQMALGAGQAILELWETTAVAAIVDRAIALLPNNNGNLTRNVAVYHQPLRLGPVAAQRSFQLRINTLGTGATPSWQLTNTNVLGFKTWLRAMAY